MFDFVLTFVVYRILRNFIRFLFFGVYFLCYFFLILDKICEYDKIVDFLVKLFYMVFLRLF